jgi:hypothetical protein
MNAVESCWQVSTRPSGARKDLWAANPGFRPPLRTTPSTPRTKTCSWEPRPWAIFGPPYGRNCAGSTARRQIGNRLSIQDPFMRLPLLLLAFGALRGWSSCYPTLAPKTR